LANPSVIDWADPGLMRVISLKALARIKLKACRLYGRTHASDLIGARLIDAAWLERLPADLAALLKAILHDPMGSGSRVRSQSCAPPGQPFIRRPCPITASFAHPLGGWGFILLGRRIP